MAAEVDIEATGLLDGLEGQARRERAELVEWLLERGFSADEIADTPTPMMLPGRRLVGDDGTRISARQMCDETGLDLDLLAALQRALGQPRADDPDAEVLARADGRAAALAKQFIDQGLTAEQVLTVGRVLGQGLSQTAEVMRQVALEAVLAPGATELQLAQSYHLVVEAVAPMLGPMCQEVLMLQLRHALETEAVNVAERTAGTLPGARDVAVMFADLVGFTKLGEAVPPEELENLANRLSTLTHHVVEPPVRFVKTIGDAVMLVSIDAVPLLQAGLRLLDAADGSDDFPQLRVGIAYGPAVSRAGDWFGSSINLASRVTAAARPNAVLVTESAHDAIGSTDEFEWSFAGARHLKGIKGEVKLFRVRWASA